jgi:multicomponent Na+:H+ antiporter subunit A
MSAATFVLGTALFLARERVDALLQRLVLPFNGIGVFTSMWNACINAGARLAALTQRPSPAAQMPLPVLAFAAVAVAYLVWSPPVPPVLPGTTRGVDWFIIALLGATVVGAILQRSRLGAIVLVGLAGFVVGLWFLLAGAPDLAITQVLFEVITVVVAVLVLRSLPRRFHEVRRARRASAAALALLAGAGAGLATYALTGRRDRSDVAEHLLRESESQTGGTNVVNTILVDFRGLDTLGEITVLVAAGLGVAALMDATGRTAATRPDPVQRTEGVLIVDVVRRALTPVLAALSLYLLLRGHDEPGGGFIAGLVAGCGIALLYLARPTSGRPPLRPRPRDAGAPGQGHDSLEPGVAFQWKRGRQWLGEAHDHAQ